MTIFLLTFALRSVGRNYEALWRMLQEAEAVQGLESSWLMETNSSIEDISRALLAQLGPEDRLLIVEIPAKARWAGTRLDDGAGPWLKQRRP